MILLGKPEGKIPLGRSRRMWVDNIKMYLREIGLGCMDWIHHVQNGHQWRALENVAINLRVLKPLGKARVSEGLAASQEGFSSMESVLAKIVPMCLACFWWRRQQLTEFGDWFPWTTSATINGLSIQNLVLLRKMTTAHRWLWNSSPSKWTQAATTCTFVGQIFLRSISIWSSHVHFGFPTRISLSIKQP
jgi:hypothetical protein